MEVRSHKLAAGCGRTSQRTHTVSSKDRRDGGRKGGGERWKEKKEVKRRV